MHGRIEPGRVLFLVAARTRLGTRVVRACNVAVHDTLRVCVRRRVTRNRALGLPRVATGQPNQADAGRTPAGAHPPVHSLVAWMQLLAKKSRNRLTLVGTWRAEG